MGAILIVLGAVLGALLLWPRKLSGTTAIAPPASSQAQIDPIYSSDGIQQLIRSNAEKFNIPPALLKAVVKVESNFNPYAVNPSDPSYGLCQVTPILAATYGYVRDWRNPTDAEIAFISRPDVNCLIGARFLGYTVNKYGLDIGVQMYNCGETGYNTNGVRVPAYLEKVKRWYDEYRA